MSNLRRYPGPRPFLYEDHEMFFGRKNETEFLTTLILNNRTTVLQGKSGYGKSSLINAGIIPNIVAISNAEIIKIRLYNYDKSRGITPKDTLLKTLQIYQLSKGSYLEGILPENHVSAWSLLKKLHADSMEMEKVGLPMHADTMPDPGLSQTTVNGAFEIAIDKLYILVFDQFEELFTYPREQVQDFGKELFDVIQNRIPEDAQQSILTQCQTIDANHKEEFAILNKDLPVKMVFSIRSDRFTYLTYLKGYLPNFLNNTYKLRRMQLPQVREAIIEPAKLEKKDLCPPFTIEPGLLQKIIDFLSYTKDEIRKVETFEMQIICSKLEEVAIKFAADQKVSGEFELNEDVIFQYGGINNKENFLSEFIQNYYSDTINSIKEVGERLAARYFIEKKLIDPISKNRISLDYVFVQEIGICKQTLATLVDKKIIRVETNSVNGKSFEISHDSLVQPIMIAANIIGRLETKIQSYVATVLNRFQSKDDQRLKEIIYDLSDAERVETGLTQNDNPIEFALLKNCDLLTKVDYSASDQHKDNRLILKDAFRPVVQQLSKSAHQHTLNERVKKYWLTFAVAAGVILILASTAVYLWRLSNRYQGLVYIGFNVDSVKNKYHAVALTNYLYKKAWNDDAANAKIEKKLSDLIHSPDIQARLSIHDRMLTNTQLRPQDVDLSFDGKYVVVNDIGNITAMGIRSTYFMNFKKASYAYFLNKTHLVIVVYKDLSETTSKGDSFIIYDMDKEQTLVSVPLGKGRSLFDPIGYGSLPDLSSDLKRVRITFTGNLLIPLVEKSAEGSTEKVGIWSADKELKYLNTEMTTSLSRDGKHIMIGQWKSVVRPFIEIRDENGLLKDTISDVYFGEFTPNGSAVYIRKGNLVIRNYAEGQRYTERSYWVHNRIEHVMVNNQQTMAMARTADSAFFVDLNTGSIVYVIPKASVIGFDADNETVYLIGRIDSAGSKKPDMEMLRYHLRSSQATRISLKKEISSFQYNDKRNAMLVQTTDNFLYLLDADLRVKTRLQITANDLFQFSRNGNVFYYVLNNRLCIFDNKYDIINLANFESAYSWIHKSLPTGDQMQKILDDYQVTL